MSQIRPPIVELLYGGQKYFVQESDLRDADVIQIGDSLISLHKTGVEHTVGTPRLVHADYNYEMSNFPVLKVVKVSLTRIN